MPRMFYTVVNYTKQATCRERILVNTLCSKIEPS